MDLKLKDNNKLKFAPFIQLEYIESTGTQYIDTGIKADNNNQTFKIGISFLGNDQVIGSGERNRNQATATICRNTNKDLVINWGTWSASGSVLQSNYLLQTLAEIEIKAGNVVKLNGSNTTITAQNVSFTSGRTANFILNGSEDAVDGSISGCVIRTHYFIVENDGREIIHLIPSKHNNIPCMYDTVTETFFYNSGTGNFIAGPIVGGLLPDNITLKTTTFYHKNTPNVDGLQLLNGILYVQETAEDVVLNRIRVDIGNVSGSLSEILQYAGMAGFNDNYEPQTKPRLVGTWTITGYITQEQLEYLQSAFDGLTIIASNIISAENCIVQSFDKNAPNYNPAIAIYHKSLCVTVNNIDGTRGLALLPAAIGSSYSFGSLGGNESGVDSVTDSTGLCVESYVNGEVKETTYYVEDFSYLKKLTQVTSLTFGVSLCNHIKNHVVDFPPNMTSFNGVGNWTFNRNGDRIYYRFPKTVNDVYANFYTAPTSALIFTGNVPTTRRDYGSFMSPQTFVGSGVDYYKDMRMYETYLATNKFNCNLWYTYTVPSISYSDGLCSVSVTRIKDLVRLSYKKSTDESWTEIENNGTFEWDGSGYVDAKAEYSNNDVYYSMRFYSETVESPTISHNTTTKQITLSSNIPNTTIYYTLDETYPTLDSTTYSDPIDATELGDIVKVRCFAVKDGMNDSEVIGKMCVMDDSLWGTDGDDSYFAVQCMDSTKPNYNPAVCIILDNNNKLTDKCYGGGGYLTKTDAATIPNIGTSWLNGWFINKGTVVDSSHIMDGGSYDFEEFTEFQYFTSVTSIPDCANAPQMQYCAFSCNKLKTIVLPSSLTYIGTGAFNCPLEGDIVIPNGVTELTQNCFASTKANFVVHDQITVFGYNCFGGNATIDRFPSNLTTLLSPHIAKIYRNDYTLPATCINMSYGREWSGSPLLNNCVHWLAPALTAASYNNINDPWHFAAVSKVYVGTGEDKDADDVVLAEYQSHLTSVANKFDTWYNYLHPQS